MRKLTRIAAIKEFFQKDGGRAVTMEDVKSLTEADRKELEAHRLELLSLEGLGIYEA